jgi:hypothetical protein
MRTLIVVAIGLAAGLAFAYAAQAMHRAPVAGTLLFIACWCGVDLMVGVRVGYSLVEELGIHLVVFIVPAAGAWLAARLLA